MHLNASLFLSRRGNKGRSRGENTLAKSVVKPLSEAIFIIPDHRHKIPAIVISSETAEAPLSIIAFESRSPLPRKIEHKTLIIIIPDHI